MIPKIISKWKIMNLSQRIVAVILLLLIAGSIATPIYSQISARIKIKQSFMEVCTSATSATNSDSACDCAWKKALDKYGYDRLGDQMRFYDYVSPIDLTDWIIECQI